MIQRKPKLTGIATTAFAANRERTISGRESSLDGQWIALSADGRTIADSDSDLEALLDRLHRTTAGVAGYSIEHFYIEDAASVGGVELQ